MFIVFCFLCKSEFDYNFVGAFHKIGFCKLCNKPVDLNSLNYFELFGLTPTPYLNSKDLEERLIFKLKQIHPDVIESKEIATKNSSFYNRAYGVLKCKHKRLDYIFSNVYRVDLTLVQKDSDVTHDPKYLQLLQNAFIWREKCNKSELTQKVENIWQRLSNKIEIMLNSGRYVINKDILFDYLEYNFVSKLCK